MSVKDYNKCINVFDATTGDVIDTILLRNYSLPTVEIIINDLFTNDFSDNEHGLLIKYGIKQ